MILVVGRSPGGGHGNPFQYSCLEDPHGQRSLAVYGVAKSQTRLSFDYTHTHFFMVQLSSVHDTGKAIALTVRLKLWMKEKPSRAERESHELLEGVESR